MSNSEKLIGSLQAGIHDESLRRLYTLDGNEISLTAARTRRTPTLESPAA